MAALSGTITVSTCSSAAHEENRTCWGMKRPVLLQRRVQLKRQPLHMYVSERSGIDNMWNQCTNVAEFTLKYNEEHLLMANMLPTIRQVVVEEDGPVKIDNHLPCVQLVFMVRVMPRNTEVTVGPDTPLSLLLDIGCLHVEPLMLTNTQIIQLLGPGQQQKQQP